MLKFILLVFIILLPFGFVAIMKNDQVKKAVFALLDQPQKKNPQEEQPREKPPVTPEEDISLKKDKPEAPMTSVHPAEDIDTRKGAPQAEEESTVSVIKNENGIVHFHVKCSFCGFMDPQIRQTRAAFPGQKKMEMFRCSSCGKSQKIYIETP